jgi:hypothetical protein
MKIIFWGKKWFIDKKFGTPVKGGPDAKRGENVPEIIIPPQKPLKEEISPAAAAAVGSATKLAAVGNVLFNFLMSASLN